jgi:transglutaminase/protease-like cytokinesis protein 3
MQSLVKFFILIGLFFLSSKISSQDYQAVDSIVDEYPTAGLKLDDVVNAIQKDFSREDEKARAVFRWVTTQISFDIELAEKMGYKSLKAFSYSTESEKMAKEKSFKEALIVQTFITKKTVCHGYAVLIEYLCEKLKIETEVIIGILKTDPSEIGAMPTIANHAWNAVKINGEWKFLDATLGAGFISSTTGNFKFDFADGYFFTDSNLFFLNHYPLDEKWLLVSKSKKDFETLPCYFRNYIKYNYKIAGPPSGLYIKKNVNFIFTVKGIDEYDSVQYSLNSIDNQKIVLEHNHTKDFDIDLSKVVHDYLSIYINDRIMVVYKIIE